MTLRWVKTRDLNINLAARKAGFDLNMFDSYPKDIQKSVKSRTINKMNSWLDDEWRKIRENATKSSKRFSDISKGIYVMSLASGFAVQYPLNKSSVIYIGKGAIKNRLDAHFKSSLFDLYRSLHGANFCFHFCEPKRQKAANYYGDVETDLLYKFQELFGDDQRPYPLLNYNSGRTHKYDHDHGRNWHTPLKNSGARYRWVLSPTAVAGWPKKLRDR
jgi:hypothetical protein